MAIDTLVDTSERVKTHNSLRVNRLSFSEPFLDLDPIEHQTVPWHHNLTNEEKCLIEDSSEHPLFEIIDGMPFEHKQAVYQIIGAKPEYLGDYNNLQSAWLKRQRKFLEDNSPGKTKEELDQEFLTDIEQKGTPLRFKLWYIDTFPNRIQIKGGLDGASLKAGFDYERALNIAEYYCYYANLARPFFPRPSP